MLTFIIIATLGAIGVYFYFMNKKDPFSDLEENFKNNMKNIQKEIEQEKDRLQKELRKKMRDELDEEQKASYNEKRQRFVERMTRLKLVYNEETDEWEKLKELE